MPFWIEIHMICLNNSRKMIEKLNEIKFRCGNYKNCMIFTHHSWYVSLVTSILKTNLYGRVGGVSRGEYAYPDILVTGRLCHSLWELPNFSFRQYLFFLLCYINFSIKFHIHNFFWMDTSPIDYWHFQTLCPVWKMEIKNFTATRILRVIIFGKF